MTLLLVQPEDGASATNNIELSSKKADVFSVPDISAASSFLKSHEVEVVLLELARGADLERCVPLQSQFPNLAVGAILPKAEIDQPLLLRALRMGLVDVLEYGESVQAQLQSTRERVAVRAALEAETANGNVGAQQLKELERDHRAGRYIQMGMLPPSPMVIDKYRLCHKVLPSLYLSGDFVDYFRITERHFIFYMADVSGHGASSAFVTVLLKNFSRRLRREYKPAMLSQPGLILAWLNEELLENRLDKHVSMFVGVVDVKEHSLSYSNAGHFPHAMLLHENECQFIEMNGKPIGLFRDVNYDSAKLDLKGDIQLALVSDGILEIMQNPSLEAKERHLLEALKQAKIDDRYLWEMFDVSDQDDAPDDISFLTITKE